MFNDKYYSALLSPFFKNAELFLLAGSSAEGFATRKSDIDAVIVTKCPESYGTVSGEYYVGIHDDIKCEILILSVNDYLTNVDAVIANNNFQLGNKLFHGYPLHGSYEDFPIRESKFRYEKAVVEKYSQVTLMKYLSLEGEKLDCHHQQYQYSLSEYLFSIVELYLLTQNDFFCKRKWLVSRFLRLCGEDNELFKEFVRVCNLSCNSTFDKEHYEKSVLKLASWINYLTTFELNPSFEKCSSSSVIPCYSLYRDGRYFSILENISIETDKQVAMEIKRDCYNNNLVGLENTLGK